MKTTTHSTAKKFVLLVMIVLAGSSFTLNKKDKQDKDAEEICLEISGDIGFEGDIRNQSYKVELIHYNTVIQTDTMENLSSVFRFHLKKNAYYTIRISKEGYAPKLVSVCTILDENVKDNVYCQFHFTTSLITRDEAARLDKDALEFPIAVVSYDKIKKAFYDNKKYTANIKKVLYSTTNQEQQ
jgi:hypothetical protein